MESSDCHHRPESTLPPAPPAQKKATLQKGWWNGTSSILSRGCVQTACGSASVDDAAMALMVPSRLPPRIAAEISSQKQSQICR